MSIPRKLKKQIPVGYYCYTPVQAPSAATNWVYKIKSCPFYKHVDELDGYCKLVKCEITDQVKDCGLRHGKEN